MEILLRRDVQRVIKDVSRSVLVKPKFDLEDAFSLVDRRRKRRVLGFAAFLILLELTQMPTSSSSACYFSMLRYESDILSVFCFDYL